MDSHQRGDEGEDQAAAYLEALGYAVLKRNLRCRSGEVDIVVYRGDALVFVEVKHWLTVPAEDLERSINRAKRLRLLGCSREYLRDHPEWRGSTVRFDIVHVGPETLTHFENAFTETGFQ